MLLYKVVVSVSLLVTIETRGDFRLEDVTALTGEKFDYQIGDDEFLSTYSVYKIVQRGHKKLPEWLTFDSNSSMLIGYPEIKDIGKYTLKIRAQCIDPIKTTCQDKLSRTFHINVLEPLKSAESRGRNVNLQHGRNENWLFTNRPKGNRGLYVEHVFAKHEPINAINSDISVSSSMHDLSFLYSNSLHGMLSTVPFSNNLQHSVHLSVKEIPEKHYASTELNNVWLPVVNISSIISSPVPVQSTMLLNRSVHLDISSSASDILSMTSSSPVQLCESNVLTYYASILLHSEHILTSAQEKSVILKWSEFISKDVKVISLTRTNADIYKQASNSKFVLTAGPGNVVESLTNSFELTWHINCGYFDQVHDFIRVLQHNIDVGRVSSEIGFNVIAWYVYSNQPLPRRVKRNAHNVRRLTATPSLLPTPITLSIEMSTSQISRQPSSSILFTSDVSLIESTSIFNTFTPSYVSLISYSSSFSISDMFISTSLSFLSSFVSPLTSYFSESTINEKSSMSSSVERSELVVSYSTLFVLSSKLSTLSLFTSDVYSDPSVLSTVISLAAGSTSNIFSETMPSSQLMFTNLTSFSPVPSLSSLSSSMFTSLNSELSSGNVIKSVSDFSKSSAFINLSVSTTATSLFTSVSVHSLTSLSTLSEYTSIPPVFTSTQVPYFSTDGTLSSLSVSTSAPSLFTSEVASLFSTHSVLSSLSMSPSVYSLFTTEVDPSFSAHSLLSSLSSTSVFKSEEASLFSTHSLLSSLFISPSVSSLLSSVEILSVSTPSTFSSLSLTISVPFSLTSEVLFSFSISSSFSVSSALSSPSKSSTFFTVSSYSFLSSFSSIFSDSDLSMGEITLFSSSLYDVSTSVTFTSKFSSFVTSSMHSVSDIFSVPKLENISTVEFIATSSFHIISSALSAEKSITTYEISSLLLPSLITATFKSSDISYYVSKSSIFLSLSSSVLHSSIFTFATSSEPYLMYKSTSEQLDSSLFTDIDTSTSFIMPSFGIITSWSESLFSSLFTDSLFNSSSQTPSLPVNLSLSSVTLSSFTQLLFSTFSISETFMIPGSIESVQSQSKPTLLPSFSLLNSSSISNTHFASSKTLTLSELSSLPLSVFTSDILESKNPSEIPSIKSSITFGSDSLIGTSVLASSEYLSLSGSLDSYTSFSDTESLRSISEIMSSTTLPSIIPTSASVWLSSSESSINSTTVAPDREPILNKSIDHLEVIVGRYFKYPIPVYTFSDKEDGNTRNLSLNISLPYGKPLPVNSWLFFNTTSQTLYGIPMKSDLIGEGTITKFILYATDSQSQAAKDAISITYKYDKSVNHKVRLTLNGSYDHFQSDRTSLIHVALNIAKFYDDRNMKFITFASVEEGSIVISWGNNSLFGTICQKKHIQDLYDKLYDNGSLSSTFVSLFSSYVPLSASLQYLGMCMLPVTTGTPPIQSSLDETDDDMWIEILLPALIAILVVVIIAIVLLICCRHKQPKKDVKDSDKPAFLEDRQPIIFPEELEMVDPSLKPKTPLVLPSDYLKETPPAVPPHGRPAPLYHTNTPEDRTRQVLDRDQLEPLTGDQPQESNPPPYRLPPPYFNPHRIA